MSFTELIFWISLFLLFFCYIGYGLLLYLLNLLTSIFRRKKDLANLPELPAVTIIVAAYNEKETLARKIENIRALDYPGDKLKTIFVTDGSTDNSESIISQFPSVLLLHQQARSGKTAAIKRAMKHVETPIVVFTDANTDLNEHCIRRIVSHYADPKVGGVAGEKKIIQDFRLSAVGQAEGIYWKYESFMKKQDAAFNTVVGAAGELFSIRTSLFKAPPDKIILDDFVISMSVCLQGYKIAYEPDAYAAELPSVSLPEEEKRKVRISAGAYQCISYLSDGLNIFRHPILSFQFISRRLLRWVFCPIMLLALFISNLTLAWPPGAPVLFLILFYAQLFFYLLAVAGWILIRRGAAPGLLTVPFYFTFMNYCLVKGFLRFARGKQTVLWEKSARQYIN
jgi:cellulose synthase/poly-beta-1,6-N-acetylglucosamine synthase-like glycosyltransferase